jgi:hypothetical protein
VRDDSRGKKGIHIFTCDKEELRDNITRSGHANHDHH